MSNQEERRNPAKNSSNPRTPKTRKSSPLTHGFGRGIKGKRTTKGSHIFPPSNPQGQQLIQNKLGATKSIHQIHSQSIEDGLLRHVSLIHLDMNI
jgi:hypothetical protein